MDEYAELRQMQRSGQLQHEQKSQVPAPHFPWPTSKPGPFVTPPPPGEKPLRGRTDQMLEVAYNQETGTPATDDPRKWYPDEVKEGTLGFDQRETAQEVARKRQRRQ